MTVKTALVLVTALILQVSLVARFSLDGARGDLLLLVTVSAAVAYGPEKGAIVGFAAGLAFDLVVDTPFGLSALVYCVAGFGVGLFQGSVLRVAWWMPVASVTVGSAAAVVLYGLLAAMLGEGSLSAPPLLTVAVVVAMLNGLLAPLSTRLMHWALADTEQRDFMPR